MPLNCWTTGTSSTTSSLEDVINAWTALGAGYLGGIERAAAPDLEHVVLLTAMHGKHDPRMVVMAITWLSRYSSLIAEHRLCKLIRDGAIAAGESSGLGLILNIAIANTSSHDRSRNLERPMKLCRPAASPGPYFIIDQTNEAMRQRAKRRASDLSARWNLWVEPLAPKYDALRSRSWVIAHNPDLAFRADFRGDLRATILLALSDEDEGQGAGSSVSELARRCGVTRTAISSALNDLELANRVRSVYEGRVRRIARAA